MFRKLSFIAAILLFAAGCTQKSPVVNYKVWYNWPERQLPADFDALGTPDVQGTKINIDLADIVDTVNHFVVLFETDFKVAKTEEYTFKLASDDGTKLYIDGELLIENDGAHGPILKTASKSLSKGRHPLRLEFFDFDKGQSLSFTYLTPTIPEREFNDQVMKEEDRLSDKDDFVMPQIGEALERFNAWKGSDETVVFPILTDVHTAGRFTFKHIGFGVRAAESFGADFMANLGDIGLNAYPATVDSDYAQFIVSSTREQMDKYDGVWIYTPGNHDWDAGDGTFFTEDYLSETFQKPYEGRAGGRLHLTPGKTYGWYDIPEKNFRIVFLNSQATGTQGGYYYIYGEEQLDWLRNLLYSTPEGMTVLVTSHLMPHPLGVWANTKPAQSRVESCEALMGLLSEYAPGHNLAGMVCGDAHVNFSLVENGVNCYVSQGYGWVSPDLMLPGQTHAFFDYKETLCIDVVAIKPAKREVHTFRIGAGGLAYDYKFSYSVMKRLFFLIICAFSCTMLSAQLLPDGSVQFVAYWNKGDLMKYQVVQRNERIDEKGDTTVIKSSSEVMSLEVADVTDSTYTLAVRSDDLFSVDTRIKDDSFLERVEMSPIRLVTDSFGTPKYYENLDELVEETKALIPQIVESIYKSVNKNDRKLLDKKAMKENLVASLATPEFIEAICEEEVTALLQFHGVRLDTTSMFTVPSQRTVLNSEPIDVNTDFWVDSAQTDSTFAVIRMHTHIGLDQLSGVAASFADWSLSLFKGNHEGDVASELDKTFDTVFKDMEGGVDEYSFLLIHLPTGWPVQYEFYKETTISHDGKTFQQIESRTVELLSEDDE